MFTTAPTSIVNIARWGCPVVRIEWFMPKPMPWNTSPRRMTDRYDFAYGITSGVAPDSLRMGSRNTRPTTVTAADAMRSSESAWPRMRSPSS